MTSIRARLLVALLTLVALVSLLAGALTYRRVLAETSTLFDYQLRQMALSLRSQVSLAPRHRGAAAAGRYRLRGADLGSVRHARVSVAAGIADDQSGRTGLRAT